MPSTIGRYQVLERVGRGGMGVLYRGIDPVLDREVAIKLMLMDFSEDEEVLRPRFYREARAVAKLQHRNVVTIFEFAEEGRTPYIVMEFLRGASLADRAKDRPPLTLDDKLDIMAQLCVGLAYAHEQGIVHRDVKPANIFILTDGTVKLLDFGIAKLTTSTLTRQGDMLGSAAYMSPEQVAGSDAVDGRADIFSAGVVLYELIAGQRPFQADQPTAIIMKILQEDPPPIGELVPGLPPQLVAAVNRALAKSPDARFATAAELARELQRIRKELPAGQAADAFEETRFASTSVIRSLQQNIANRTPVPAAAAADVPGAPPAGRKWLVPAAIAGVVLALALGATLLTRGASPAVAAKADAPSTSEASPPAKPTAAAANTPAPAGAPAAVSSTLQLASDPAGAAIVVDGRDTRQVTPAAVTVTGAGPHRLRLSKTGFQSFDARLSGADVQKGSLSYTLVKTEAATIPVSLSGQYAFAVLDGSKTISDASDSHDLSVPVGKTLSIVSPQYMLNQQVRIDGAPGRRLEIQAPALGKLTVLTKFETCSVKINGHDLGYPPITNQPIAAGSYKIDLICPNGQNQVGNAVVTAGQATTARIF